MFEALRTMMYRNRRDATRRLNRNSDRRSNQTTTRRFTRVPSTRRYSMQKLEHIK